MAESHQPTNLDNLTYTEAMRILEERYPGEEIKIEQSGDRPVYHAGNKLLDSQGNVVDTHYQGS